MKESSVQNDSPNDQSTLLNRQMITKSRGLSHRSRLVLISAALLFLLVILTVFLLPSKKPVGSAPIQKEKAQNEAEANEVSLPAEALASKGIETAEVTERSAAALLSVTGAVEANAEREQVVTPLVAGRLAAVTAVLGQRVTAGSILATIQSPQIAELRGQLLEARSKLALATANVERVRQSANRAAVISAKAKLDLAEKTLDRQRRLLEIGAGSRKEVEAAETEYQTAKAEYDFQSTIAINKEFQEADSERVAARVTVERLQQSLVALGANPDSGKADSLIAVRAPAAGTVIKREVNPGAGVKEGDALFTIANLSTVWVIANVPESQVNFLRVGTTAEIRSAALKEQALTGRVSFIDPVLNEETRTARVRLEVPNPHEQLKAGMFVEVSFHTGSGEATQTGSELVVPDEAIQRIGERTVVFVPEEDEAGHFKVREVEIGGVSAGYRRIISGLTSGERVVTKGSFILKSLLLKSQFGEDND